MTKTIGKAVEALRDELMSGRFLDITLDPVFKKALGRKGCEARLASLINTLLRLKGEDRISSIEIIAQEEVPDNPERKRALVDVRCVDKKGHHFIVEIQRDFDKNLEKSLQFYGARTYVNQIKKGEEHDKLKPVIVIVLVDYVLFRKKERFLSHHCFLDTETYENDFKDLSFCVFEMPKFREHPEYSKGPLESIWLDALANSKNKKDIPQNLPKEVEEFYHDIDGLCWSDSERDMLDKYLDEVRVYKSDVKHQLSEGRKLGLTQGIKRGKKEGIAQGIETGRKEGIETGRKEGIETGRKEGILKTARILKKKGYSCEEIAEITELSSEEIKTLN